MNDAGPHPADLHQPGDSPSLQEWERHFPGLFDNVSTLSGAANIILQLSNPAVGYGVKESTVRSGNVFVHPYKRGRTTFTYLAVAMAGTAEEKLAYRAAVDRSHEQVRSTEKSPVRYNAFDPELQLWVASCLYYGFRDVWSKLRGEPSRADTEKLLKMSEPLATTLQVPPERWHPSLDAFEAYWEKNLNAFTIDETLRAFLLRIAGLEFLGRPLSGLFGRFNRFVTTGFLPPQVREKMRLPWDARRQRHFDRLMRFFGFMNRLLPLAVRGLFLSLMLRDLRRRRKKGKPLV